MDFQAFDENYVRQLAEGDRSIQEHFAAYFGDLLDIKLRARVRAPHMIEDIRQETLKRVLEALRRPRAIERPERLGAYVSSVCNNVMFEAFRNSRRHKEIGPELGMRADVRIDPEVLLVNQERRHVVEEVLAQLSKRDQELLRMIFLDEEENAAACRRLGVGKGYLRILLHRAKSRFVRKLAERPDFAMMKSLLPAKCETIKPLRSLRGDGNDTCVRPR